MTKTTMSLNEWVRYRDILKKVNEEAADTFRDAVFNVNGRWKGVGLGEIPRDELIDYAYALATKYGEASAAAAAEMFEKTAMAQGAASFEVLPAETASYNEVAKTVNGVLKRSQNVNEMAGAVSRMVKQAGCDTTLQNADRYNKKYGKKKNTGAQVAWIPSGDTCPFCLMLASNGWRNETVKGAENHAEHVHANCDCAYMVRFNTSFSVGGYDPDVYKEMFDNAEGDTWEEKINSMRRANYEKNKDEINAKKRAAYADRKTHSMKRNEKTSWQGVAKKVTEEEVVGLGNFASNLGVVLDPSFKSFDGDIGLVEDFLTTVSENLDGRSFVRNRKVRLAVSYTMDDADYAITNGATITINGFAYRNRELLEADYNKRLKDRWFTEGSTYLDIGTHESAHVIVYLDQLKVSGAMDAVFGLDKSSVIDKVISNISEYALKNNDELAAESYVAYRNGSKNEYVLKVIRYSGIVK